MGHTPGPWAAGMTAAIYSGKDCERLVAVVATTSHTSQNLIHANAKLIAASPDMLDALKGLVYQVDRLKGEESQVLDTDQARAAIEAAS